MTICSYREPLSARNKSCAKPIATQYRIFNSPGYGWHRIRLEAVDGSVDILGLFTYDSRSNRKAERRLTGFAAPGETIQFSRPFKTRPIVFCNGGLAAVVEDVTTTSVTFGGQAVGGYEVIGE